MVFSLQVILLSGSCLDLRVDLNDLASHDSFRIGFVLLLDELLPFGLRELQQVEGVGKH